jgi:hypothetical protein
MSILRRRKSKNNTKLFFLHSLFFFLSSFRTVLYDWCVLLKLIYIVDVVVISVLLFLIVSTIILGKHYMDEAEGKGIVEKLYLCILLFHSTTLFSDINTFFNDVHMCENICE